MRFAVHDVLEISVFGPNSCFFAINYLLYIILYVYVIWDSITVFELYTLLAFLGDFRGGFVFEGSYSVFHYY